MLNVTEGNERKAGSLIIWFIFGNGQFTGNGKVYKVDRKVPTIQRLNIFSPLSTKKYVMEFLTDL